MDERDKDLTHLFVRDLDEIPLPPRGAWRRTQGRETIVTRTSRYLLTAGAVVAVLAIALIAGVQLNQRQQTVAGPSASPTPSTVAALPSATASATTTSCLGPCGPTGTTNPAPGGAISNDDFGFLVTDVGSGATIRKESSNARVGNIDGQSIAVSPDGRQIAYFTVPGSTPGQLKVATAANPNSAVFQSSLSANERGGVIAWSADGAALIYSVNTGSPTTASTVRTLDLPSGGAAQVVQTSTAVGVILQPIAWDPQNKIAAVGETGEGGFMPKYDVINFTTTPPTITRSDVPVRIVMNSVKASTDAKLAVGLDLDAGGFTYWPLQSMSGAGRHPAESKYGMTGGFAWRPGTHEIGFIGPSNQFWLCDVARDVPLGCGHTAFSGVPDGATVRTFRADGSAVLLAVFPPGSSGAGSTTYTLVQFSTDPLAAKATGGDRVTFTDLGGLTASVRLR